MIVVDALVLLEALIGAEVQDKLQDRLLATGESLHAPHLIDVEVAQVIRRFEARGDLSERRAGEALNDLRDFALCGGTRMACCCRASGPRG